MKHTTLAFVLLVAACGSKSAAPTTTPTAPPPAEETAATSGVRTPATSFDVQDNRLVLPGPIVFNTGGAELDESASEAALWQIHDFLAAKPYVTLLRIEGHSDTPDDADYLSGERALNVGHWLVEHDIDCKRLLAAAFSNTKPVADPSTPEGRAQNRRIEAVVAKMRDKEVGGMPADGGAMAAVPVCD
jgi:outer membrane protein OmpA-like peptidoglycan-associated protein